MRTRIFAAALAVNALAPLSASARDEVTGAASKTPPVPVEATENTGPSETEGADVVDMPEPSAMPGDKNATSGERHTVVRGDTLWDLSQKYLGSPWYWPKVWSYNPEIANPHWIYPGNNVRFAPAGDDAPAEVSVGAPTAVEGEAAEAVKAGETIAPEAEGVTMVGKIGYQPVDQSLRYPQVGFVTKDELDESGSIHSSFSEAEMLSFPDTAYLKFKKKGDARVGDRYVVFKTLGEVRHPLTGDRIGHQTKFLGAMRVTKVGKGDLVTAQITETWDEIHRGDRIGPFGEQLVKNVNVKKNAKALNGVVVQAMTPEMTMTGEHHLVILDKGGKDGVEVGNTFTIVRRGDGVKADFNHPSRDQDDQYPLEDIGRCMVVDVKDAATTCLLTRSLREIEPGDQVEMRTGTEPNARASLK